MIISRINKYIYDYLVYFLPRKWLTNPKKPTRTIKISEHTYRMLVGHSKRFYDVEPYDLILENILRDFEYYNQDKRWRDIES
jgi:hypothetical protein